jgi:hypothetical protein
MRGDIGGSPQLGHGCTLSVEPAAAAKMSA